MKRTMYQERHRLDSDLQFEDYCCHSSHVQVIELLLLSLLLQTVLLHNSMPEYGVPTIIDEIYTSLVCSPTNSCMWFYIWMDKNSSHHLPQEATLYLQNVASLKTIEERDVVQ